MRGGRAKLSLFQLFTLPTATSRPPGREKTAVEAETEEGGRVVEDVNKKEELGPSGKLQNWRISPALNRLRKQ